MRFSGASILALPLLAAAAQQQNPLDQAMASAQYYLEKVQSYVPHFNTYQAADAAAAKSGNNIDVLTINNWQNLLRSSVKPGGKGPEEWWVLMTGGNKTCYGMCGNVNKAYNGTALLFKDDPTAPHLGYLNCDLQPILCNAWAAGPPAVWIFEIGATAPTPVHIIPINTTSVTVETFTDLNTSKSWKDMPAYEGYFHPFDGIVAQLGVGLPLGWIIWGFAIVPSWAFMIGISFFSRTFMSRRMAPPAAGAGVGGTRPRPAPAS